MSTVTPTNQTIAERIAEVEAALGTFGESLLSTERRETASLQAQAIVLGQEIADIFATTGITDPESEQVRAMQTTLTHANSLLASHTITPATPSSCTRKVWNVVKYPMAAIALGAAIYTGYQAYQYGPRAYASHVKDQVAAFWSAPKDYVTATVSGAWGTVTTGVSNTWWALNNPGAAYRHCFPAAVPMPSVQDQLDTCELALNTVNTQTRGLVGQLDYCNKGASAANFALKNTQQQLSDVVSTASSTIANVESQLTTCAADLATARDEVARLTPFVSTASTCAADLTKARGEVARLTPFVSTASTCTDELTKAAKTTTTCASDLTNTRDHAAKLVADAESIFNSSSTDKLTALKTLLESFKRVPATV